MRNADSPVQKIFNSHIFSRWFQDDVKQNSNGPHCASLSAAKHRFASFAKPLGRMLLHVESFFAHCIELQPCETMPPGPVHGWATCPPKNYFYLLWLLMEPTHSCSYVASWTMSPAIPLLWIKRLASSWRSWMCNFVRAKCGTLMATPNMSYLFCSGGSSTPSVVDKGSKWLLATQSNAKPWKSFKAGCLYVKQRSEQNSLTSKSWIPCASSICLTPILFRDNLPRTWVCLCVVLAKLCSWTPSCCKQNGRNFGRWLLRKKKWGTLTIEQLGQWLTGIHKRHLRCARSMVCDVCLRLCKRTRAGAHHRNLDPVSVIFAHHCFN